MPGLAMNDKMRNILDHIGRGMRLVVPRDGSCIKLMWDKRFIPNRVRQWHAGIGNASDVEVDQYSAKELLNSGHYLTKLSEHGEGERCGWNVIIGIDGHKNDIYVCIQ